MDTPKVEKMGHEALLGVVMGQFGVMTKDERAALFSDLGEMYCRRCGEDHMVESRRSKRECVCGLGYWE